MKKKVDHKSRKREIITKATELFSRDGYKDVTFQTLADYCEISRTILYRYFKNKREIFDAAIIQLCEEAGERCSSILQSHIPAALRIRQISAVVSEIMCANPAFMSAIVDFVVSMKRHDYDAARQILRFTIGLKRLFHSQVVWGIHHGEFRSDVDADLYTDLLYAQHEALMIRIAFSGKLIVSDMLRRLDVILRGLEK